MTDYDECGACGHYPAYHDGQGGRPCRAWNPDRNDWACACAVWKKPVESELEPEQDYHEEYWE